MKLVFKFCKGLGGKVEAKCLSKLLSGSICFKSDQASTLHRRAPPLPPIQAKFTPGLRCLHLYSAALPRFSEPTHLPVRCKEHRLDRNLLWGKAGGR